LKFGPTIRTAAEAVVDVEVEELGPRTFDIVGAAAVGMGEIPPTNGGAPITDDKERPIGLPRRSCSFAECLLFEAGIRRWPNIKGTSPEEERRPVDDRASLDLETACGFWLCDECGRKRLYWLFRRD